MSINEEIERLVPAADTEALGLGVGRRTIGRYIKRPPEGFPTPLRINGRLYFRRAELESYKQSLIQQALAASRLDEESKPLLGAA